MFDDSKVVPCPLPVGQERLLTHVLGFPKGRKMIEDSRSLHSSLVDTKKALDELHHCCGNFRTAVDAIPSLPAASRAAVETLQHSLQSLAGAFEHARLKCVQDHRPSTESLHLFERVDQLCEELWALWELVLADVVTDKLSQEILTAWIARSHSIRVRATAVQSSCSRMEELFAHSSPFESCKLCASFCQRITKAHSMMVSSVAGGPGFKKTTECAEMLGTLQEVMSSSCKMKFPQGDLGILQSSPFMSLDGPLVTALIGGSHSEINALVEPIIACVQSTISIEFPTTPLSDLRPCVLQPDKLAKLTAFDLDADMFSTALAWCRSHSDSLLHAQISYLYAVLRNLLSIAAVQNQAIADFKGDANYAKRRISEAHIRLLQTMRKDAASFDRLHTSTSLDVPTDNSLTSKCHFAKLDRACDGPLVHTSLTAVFRDAQRAYSDGWTADVATLRETVKASLLLIDGRKG